MSNNLVTPMTVCLCTVLAAYPAGAQSSRGPVSSPGDRSFSLGTTFTAGDRIDATASPLTYGGTGLGAVAQYRTTAGSWKLGISGDGLHSSYAPRSAAPTAAREAAVNARIDLSAVRPWRSIAGGDLAFGFAATTVGEVLEHRYADVEDTRAAYASGFATIGPMSTWTRDVGSGRALVSVDAPLAGLVYQPYADARVERSGPRFRGVTASQLHAADATLRYDFTVRGAAGLFSEYRLRTFQLVDVEPIRSLNHSLAVGIVKRFGTARDRGR